MVVWVSEADRYGHAGYIPLDPERAANICGWRGSGIAMDLEAHHMLSLVEQQMEQCLCAF